MLVSVVIPCYKSEKTIRNVVEEIDQTFSKQSKYEYELVLVNDSSPDTTMEVIRSLCNERHNIKGINLAKNFGQHSALMAGFRCVKGDYIACLDDDGQTPASEIFKLLDGLTETVDVVYASYEEKKHNKFRNFGSKVNSMMLNKFLGKPHDLYISSYFATKKFVIESMLTYENPYPYVIGLVLQTTNKIINVPVNHRNRIEGNSGYTINKLLSLWLNGFTSFSVKPLRIATVCGFVFAVFGFLYAIYVIINKLLDPTVPTGWSSIIATLFFSNGIILIVLGLIGEYIGRIFISLNNSPQYVIKERLNCDEEI